MTDNRPGKVPEAALRWQCRRSMRELDELLRCYCDHRYAGAGEREKAAFRALLALPDPALVGYLLRGEEPNDRVSAHVVRQIRDRAPSQ
jgi:antitoxin CptB